MPIKFRCQHCQQFLGISRSRAGAVTDCPTCGRAIRVPDLDGTIRPVPEPQFNLQDANLASALEKLAQLGSPKSSDAVATEAPPPRVTTDSGEMASPLAPAPLPEPLEIAPAPAPVVVEPNAPVVPAAPLSEPPPGQSGPQRARELEQLARMESGIAPEPASTLTGRSRSAGATWIITAVLFTTLGFAGGWFLRPLAIPTDSPLAVTNDPPDTQHQPQPVEHVPAAAGEGTPALVGRVTYISPGGDRHPDSGARILVLPPAREGTTRLPIDGIRGAASEADVNLLRAAVRALGGDLAIADADGQYQISLPKAGEYRALILSAYQPRDESAPLTSSTTAFLTLYFERPVPVIGSTAYELRDIRYRGSETSPLDVTFEHP